MQALFIFILTGSAGLFLYHATQHLPAALLMPIPILLALPYVFTYLCVVYTGHHITNATLHPHTYPYDHILFRPSKVCSTCNIVKPARSKHCSLCRACVAQSDHHCPWVNNCLGRGNYRWFLLLLLTLSMLEFYGAFLSWYILRPYLQTPQEQPFFSSQHFRDLGNAMVFAVNVGGLSIAGVGMLTASTACLPLGLLAYHCYLIWAGMTTNESQKWADWRDDMADGLVFASSRSAVRAHLKKRLEDMNGGAATGMADFSAALGLTANAEDEPYVHWPISSDQIVVRTNDGQAPRGQEGLWRRVWSLDEVHNIYDLGGWDNLMEVMKGH